jgi:hypothetical protein
LRLQAPQKSLQCGHQDHYRLPKTIFDRLAEINVHVDRDLREFPWFAVYDMEAMLLKVE